MRLQAVAVVAAWIVMTGLAAAQTCDRECLTGISEQYLDALVAKDTSKLPLADTNIKFTENGQRLRLGDGFWNSVSGRGTYKIHLPDVTLGQIATIITMREANVPVILVTRLKVDNRRTPSECLVRRVHRVGERSFRTIHRRDRWTRAASQHAGNVAHVRREGVAHRAGEGRRVFPFVRWRAETIDRKTRVAAATRSVAGPRRAGLVVDAFGGVMSNRTTRTPFRPPWPPRVPTDR